MHIDRRERVRCPPPDSFSTTDILTGKSGCKNRQTFIKSMIIPEPSKNEPQPFPLSVNQSSPCVFHIKESVGDVGSFPSPPAPPPFLYRLRCGGVAQQAKKTRLSNGCVGLVDPMRTSMPRAPAGTQRAEWRQQQKHSSSSSVGSTAAAAAAAAARAAAAAAAAVARVGSGSSSQEPSLWGYVAEGVRCIP